MPSIRRIVAMGALAVIAAVSMQTTAQAAPAHHGTTSSAVSAAVVRPMLGKPNGCPSGDFCVYTQGNGGDLCLANSGNNPWWGDGCANLDQTLFNNGNPDPYSYVRIYWGSNYTGAWACLGLGNYWLYANQNIFNYGSTLSGYKQQVGNNAVSHKWATSCS
jgi:hypothetical protein